MKIIVILILILLLICFLIILTSRKKTRKTALPTISKEKLAHYRALGMTDEEIVFFRETMLTARNQIEVLAKNMSDTAKLRAIDLRYDTTHTARLIFKEIVKQPSQLHQADKFLYTHLPNLVELTNQYIEINEQEHKSKETYQLLTECAQTIDGMSELISKDYQQFMDTNLEELKFEISVAKDSLTRDNNSTHATTTSQKLEE